MILIVVAILFAFAPDEVADKTFDDAARLASDIPEDATERDEGFRRSGAIRSRRACYVGRELVGERFFYGDGRLADERPLKNGKLDGVWRQFHENGRLFAERPYRDGLMHGLFRFWDEDGRLLGESEMKDGTGTLREFGKYQIGAHERETPYVDGKIHGVQTLWSQFEGARGVGRGLTPYRHGVREGWEYAVDEDGTLLGAVFWKRNKLHGMKIRTDHDGNPLYKCPRYFIDGVEVSKEKLIDAAKSDETLRQTLDHKPPKFEPRPPRPATEKKVEKESSK